MSDGRPALRHGDEVSAELVVARERLRAEVDTRLTVAAFGSDSYVGMEPGSLVKASVRAVGRRKKGWQIVSRRTFVGLGVGERQLTRLLRSYLDMLTQT